MKLFKGRQTTQEAETKTPAVKEPAVKEPAAKEPAVKEPAAKKVKTQKDKARTERRQENAVVRYFRQTIAELKKTSWPTRRELTRLTVIVLVVTVTMSAMLGLIDWLFSMLFTFLIKASAG